MADYKLAVRKKLRFKTDKGNLNVEQLWDLKKEELNIVAKGLKRELKAQEEEDFLSTPSQQNELLTQKFEIVLDILNTKVREEEQKRTQAALKDELSKLKDALVRKQDAALENLSVEEIQARIKSLS